MNEYLLQNLAELAHRRAINLREEAQIWDILSRDLKREGKRREENEPPIPTPKHVEKIDPPEGRLYVRVKEAQKMMGLGHSSLYAEISAGRLQVKKSGRKTLIAVREIQAWFEGLPGKGE